MDDAEKLKAEVDAALPLDFDTGSEPWITIKVKDGAELRLKIVVVMVKRISDDPKTGEPRYFVGNDTKVRITKRATPEAMKR